MSRMFGCERVGTFVAAISAMAMRRPKRRLPIIGDAARKVSETGSHIRIKGVKEGAATIKATIAYNGKSQTLA
ncbi:hypothetical protein C8Z91_23395 [Paenibacillus elgii]|uniref:Uncharacterized protein n=1 Tax=Paenibacillus elgii TaxID=189691 RepID=A0A2T6FWU6_9BACL|nr:hypothetical protein [Paenibacillus elgii]PUA36365.1 hypothetical protein C8Z91_23395 [Paenibacillus elgii]